MTPDQWLEKNYLKEIFSGQFDHLAAIIDHLELAPKAHVITVAGTNGKGETCRSLNHLLSTQGFKTACLTSPHLVKVNERFVFGEKEIGDQNLLEIFDSIQEKLPRRVSYFEFLFLCFLKLCQQSQLDYIILEVGLGGRLDACNAVDADTAVITSISRDHQELLGHSYRKILNEKAGITRKGRPVFTSFTLDFLNQCMEEIVSRNELDWHPVQVAGLSFSQSNQRLSHKVAEFLLGHGVNVEIPIFAKRKSIETKKGLFDLFPSHNPEGIRKLFQFLNSSKYNDYDYLIVSFSQRELADIESMTKTILDRYPASKIYYYLFQHNKSLDKSRVKKLKDKFGFNQIDRESFAQLPPAKNILVTGSNYFLGTFIQHHSSC